MIPSFKLVLCDLNQELISEWEKAFANFPEVEIKCGNFTDINFDCIVSPANSFGLMDGGIDGAITDYFGRQMMDRVQTLILKRYAGEQPVGTSMIVRGTDPSDTTNSRVQFVAHTPTMILPRNVSQTTNVYMAMKAMLLAIEEHNKSNSFKINTVVCSGLGTGAGRVPAHQAANDMAKAYFNFKNRPRSLTWNFGLLRYNQIMNRTGVQRSKTCHCGQPVDISNVDCIAYDLCEDHADEA